MAATAGLLSHFETLDANGNGVMGWIDVERQTGRYVMHRVDHSHTRFG